jgi:hypothetical protein
VVNRPSSSGPLVVAVALGASGTVVSDALAPYEVFASSPRFSVYTVAADAGPAPTQGGPGIVPTYTFADTTSGRAPRPGADEAERVGQLVGYPNWSLNGPTDIPTRSMSVDDLPVGLNALIPWGRPTLGVALHDGVGEIDVASSFEVFDVSYAARPVPLSATGTVVSEHGMVLHTNTVTDTPTPTRLAIAGAGGSADLDPTLRAWADGHHVPVDAVHGLGAAPGFDGALEYLSSRAGRATAVSAAKMIDYPTTRLRLADTGGDVRIPALLVLGLALAALAAALPGRLRRTRPSRRREQLHPTGTVNGHGIPCHTPRSEP